MGGPTISRFTLIAAALFALLLAPGDGSAKTETIRVGFATWAGAGPLYVAKKRRFFREEGLKVELLKVEDIDLRMAALATGQVDVVVASVDSLARHLSRGGQGFRCIFALDDSRGGDGLLAHRDIKSLAQLEGRRVAFDRGSVSQFYLNVLLGEAGLSESSLSVVDLDPAAAGRAFIAGEVDAAVTWEPWLSKGSSSEIGHVLRDSSQNPGLITNVVLTRSSVLTRREKALKALYRGWSRAVDYVKENPKAARQIMAKGLGGWMANQRVMAEVLDGLVFYDAAMNADYFGSADRPGAIATNLSQALKIWSREAGGRVAAAPSDLISHRIIQ